MKRLVCIPQSILLLLFLFCTSNAVAQEEEAALEKEQKVLRVVEKMPEFPGGMEALTDYLTNKVDYPSKALKKGIEGVVFVSFIVEVDGSITGVKTDISAEPSLDAEAIRAVQAMPNWIPGEQDGEKVRIQFNLPFKFELPREEKSKAKD